MFGSDLAFSLSRIDIRINDRNGMFEYNPEVVAEFRANSGQVGGRFAALDLALLTTVGARTGLPRISPVAYFTDGGDIFVIASAAGSDRNPAWYHNLVANPELTVEVGADKYQAKATPTEGEERTRLFAKAVTVQPGFAEFEAKTRRRIPVLRITRISW
ncbi:nitroreductase family deazaflavin-dependent oxidoreductase [Nocardia brasiliensis]|uniref:nitroreductase family deazaflavin-dependent oxidoreductase n=1 Tax=Nocardia brasiliensis TaxID=37326 RepID=UPI002455029D|nr:nitroreductase family deazaflavin-dependent oxidoreductase [Nocardia brasiliensis]